MKKLNKNWYFIGQVIFHVIGVVFLFKGEAVLGLLFIILGELQFIKADL